MLCYIVLYYIVILPMCYIIFIKIIYCIAISYIYYYYNIFYYTIVNIIILLYDILIRVVRIVGIDMPNCMCMLFFKLRPGVLSRTLSHMWGKLNLPMFLFNMGLLTLMNMDSLIFLAKAMPLPPSLLFGSYYDWWGGLYGCCADEWLKGPSGALK